MHAGIGYQLLSSPPCHHREELELSVTCQILNFPEANCSSAWRLFRTCLRNKGSSMCSLTVTNSFSSAASCLQTATLCHCQNSSWAFVAFFDINPLLLSPSLFLTLSDRYRAYRWALCFLSVRLICQVSNSSQWSWLLLSPCSLPGNPPSWGFKHL